MISIVVATKNRPSEIVSCVAAILKNRHARFELIIADQSVSPILIGQGPVRHLHLPNANKSAALNTAIATAKGDIVAFTDDDCIVSPSWLDRIDQAFKRYPKAVAVCGSTRAYQPTRHLGMVCPATISGLPITSHITPTYHASALGFGNNMAIRKKALLGIRGFRTWLGPGSVGAAAEDADVLLRLLIDGQPVVHYAPMEVFHTKWLTKKWQLRQSGKYIRGEAVCYGYFALLGFPFASDVLRRSLTRFGKRYLPDYLFGLSIAALMFIKQTRSGRI